jgi:hypothetical protein
VQWTRARIPPGYKYFTVAMLLCINELLYNVCVLKTEIKALVKNYFFKVRALNPDVPTYIHTYIHPLIRIVLMILKGYFSPEST